jgi:hypothetical protein
MTNYVLAVIIGYALFVIPLWRIFVKAGQPGWAALIPIYNWVVLIRVAGRPGWWWLLLLIPVVNFIMLIIIYYDLARSFGHGVGFTIGLFFLHFIFLFILAFGGSRYRGPSGSDAVLRPSLT